MKQICSIVMCLALSVGTAFCLSPKDMTGWKTYGLYGKVKEVKLSDGTSLEFNADGNRTKEVYRVKSNDKLFDAVYEYKDATHYMRTSPPDIYPRVIAFTKDTRTEMWYETTEELGLTYNFDKQGRIYRIDEPNYGYGTTITFEYKDNNDKLPSKMIDEYYMEGDIDETTTTYVYHETDSNGNWTHATLTVSRKEVYYDEEKERDVTRNHPEETKEIKRTITYFTDKELKAGAKYSSSKASPDKKQGSSTAVSDSPDPASSGTDYRAADESRDMKGILISLLIGLLMSVHMAYMRFFRKPTYDPPYSVDSFRSVREAGGLPAEAIAAENAQASELLDKAYACFSVIGNAEDGEPMRKPIKYKEIKQANRYIGQAMDLSPTAPGVVEWLNTLTHFVNSNMRRTFGGSAKIVIIGIALALLLGFAVDIWLLVLYLLFSAIYVLATQMPVYLVDKRKIRNRKNAHDSTLSMMGEMISNSKFVRTTVTWSDGTETVHDDHSEKWIKIFLSFFISFMMGVLIPIWAILSYIRNYVLNWK